MPRLFKGLYYVILIMPQHLTILTTGSVFQRKLQVFSRARGRFMRSVAAGENSFLLTQIRLWNEPNFEPTFERLCISFLSLSFSFLIKLTKLMSLYSYSFYSRSNRRRSPYAETSKTGGVLDPGALLNLDGPPKISFSSTQTDAGAGNAPDDKKKGSSQKLTTYEQKILLLL